MVQDQALRLAISGYFPRLHDDDLEQRYESPGLWCSGLIGDMQFHNLKQMSSFP